MSDKAKSLIIDYHECFGTESGKRVLADLKEKFQFQTTVPDDMVNAAVRQYVGSWNVIIRILYYLDKEIPA